MKDNKESCIQLIKHFLPKDILFMEKKWYTYIITNQKNWTLYIWVTSNLEKRLREHRNKIYEGFSSKYGLIHLVRFQEFSTIEEAIEWEKKIKWRTRKKKLLLIEEENPDRNDLLKKTS